MQNNENLPALLPQSDAEIDLDRLRNRRANIVTSLDIESDEGKRLLIRAVSDPDMSLADLGPDGVTLLVKHHVAMVGPQEVEGQGHNSGEIIKRMVVKVRLILDDGRTFGWSSSITTEHWGMILAVYGHGPWNPPLKCRLRPHKKVKDRSPWWSIEVEE